MKKLYRPSHKPRIIGVIIFVVILTITQFVAYQRYIISCEAQSNKLRNEITAVSERIQTGLSYAVSATKTLAFIVEMYGEPENFDSLAAHILSTHPHIDALELTKQGVIQKVYPLTGNEKALSFDILSGGNIRNEAVMAIEKKDIFFAGPLELHQGGISLVGRYPIFLKNKFHGFAMALIRLPTLAQIIQPREASSEYKYQLSKRDPDTGAEQFFLPGSEENWEGSSRLDIPNGRWTVYVKPAKKSAALFSDAITISVFGLLLAFVSGSLARNVYRRNMELKSTLAERTARLHEQELDYKEKLERVSDAFIGLNLDYEISYANRRAEELIELCCTDKPITEAWKKCLSNDIIISEEDLKNATTSKEAIKRERYIEASDKWIQATVYPSASGLSIFIEDTTSRVKAQQQLEVTASHYRALIENSADAIALLDTSGKVNYQTSSAERITGYSIADIQTLDIFELTHPENRTSHQWVFQKVLGLPGKSLSIRYQLKKKTGEYVWVEGTYTNHLDDPRIASIVYNYHDVTDRVASEEKAEQASRLYQVISRINHSIIRATNETRMLHDVCNIAVEVGNFRMAWIGTISQSGQEILPVAYAGAYEGYFSEMSAIRLVTDVSFMDAVSNSVKSGRYYVCSDIMEVPGTDAWKASALAKSFRSSIALPIKKFDKVTGVFVIYSASTDAFNQEEISLLEEMSQDISFSLENQEREELRKKAEEELTRLSREHEVTLNRISDSVLSLDNDFRYTFLNKAAMGTHSGRREDIIGKSVYEVHPLFRDSALDKAYKRAMETQQLVEIEEYYPTMDRWFQMKIYPSPSGCTAFYKDISEQKKYQHEIVNSQAHLQAILENTSDLVWSVDENLNLLFFNDRFRRFGMFLAGKEIKPGDSVLSIVPGPYQEDVPQLCLKAFKGEQFTTERIRHYHGEERVMEFFVNPIRTEGQISGVSVFMRDVTDKKKAFSQLVEEKNFTASILNSMPGIFYLHDPNFVFRRWNENFEKVSGYSSKEISAMHPLNLFDKEEKAVMQHKIQETFDSGSAEVIVQLLTRTGKKIPYQFNIHLTHFEGSTYLIGMGIDITARVQAEKKLEASIREIGKLSKVASSTAHLVAITSPSLDIEWVNDSFCHVTGLKADELTGLNYLEILKSAGTDHKCIERVRAALNFTGNVSDELVSYSKTDVRYWLNTNINAVYDVDGTVANYIIVQSDITELKEYEQRVTSIAEDLRNLIENANAIIFGVDHDGYFNEWNHHATITTGFEREEMLGRHMRDSVDDPRRGELQQLVKVVLTGSNILRKEIQIIRKDGSPCILLLSATPRRNAAGEIKGIIVVGQDITELTEYRTSLEKKVQIRTEQLNVAMQREKELAQLKTRFASMVSHEFRTPLATIGLGANFLKRYRDRLTPEMIDAKSDAILTQVDHMAYLLEDVLTLGKTEDTKIKINRTKVNILEFCDKIKEQVENVTKKTHVVETDFKFLSPDIVTDEDLLRNIFINLIGNAIKFSPGKDRVVWDAYQEGDTMIFTVKDFGIGIPEEDREKIFQPFDRGSNTADIPGTGLGLSIVKKAVELLRGYINVSSKPGEGSTFTIMLPTDPDKSVLTQ